MTSTSWPVGLWFYRCWGGPGDLVPAILNKELDPKVNHDHSRGWLPVSVCGSLYRGTGCACSCDQIQVSWNTSVLVPNMHKFIAVRDCKVQLTFLFFFVLGCSTLAYHLFLFIQNVSIRATSSASSQRVLRSGPGCTMLKMAIKLLVRHFLCILDNT